MPIVPRRRFAGAGRGKDNLDRRIRTLTDKFEAMPLFVASDEASFSTGSEFIANGGHLLGPVPDSSPQA